MQFQQFKMFVLDLIKTLILKCDTQAKADAATISKLSADAEALAAKVKELESALVASKDEAAKALASQAAAQADDLNALSSELQATFNPTPVADAVAVASEEAGEVVTPVEVTEAVTIDEPVATAPEVAEAAVAAIGEAAAE